MMPKIDKKHIIIGILPLTIIIALLVCVYVILPRDFIVELNDASLIISILGGFATVSVTFITLLFAIAAINASFQVVNNSHPDDYCSEGGVYTLKLLIKADLMPTALKTIIPQLVVMWLVFLISPFVNETSDVYSESVTCVFGCCASLGLIILLALLLCSLWNATNSVYYSIVQSNYDYQLTSTLTALNKTGYFSLVKSYYPKPYDVYAVKKTLYPNIHKEIYSTLRNSDALKFQKDKLVEEWNQEFINVLQNTLNTIREKHNDSITLIRAIKQEGEEKKFGLLKMLKPKIQAPEKVTKICLDLLYHAPMSKEMNLIPYDKETLEQCLILLAAHKYYAESRQEERKKHNVRINRARYSNPNDMHAYMLYGYILYLLGEYEYRGRGNINSAKDYYTESICSYRCATIANPINKDAKNNLATLINYVSRLPFRVDIPKWIGTRYKT